jgi:hypothetical protein
MTHLKLLDVQDTEISGEGLARLKSALAKTAIRGP